MRMAYPIRSSLYILKIKHILFVESGAENQEPHSNNNKKNSSTTLCKCILLLLYNMRDTQKKKSTLQGTHHNTADTF